MPIDVKVLPQAHENVFSIEIPKNFPDFKCRMKIVLSAQNSEQSIIEFPQQSHPGLIFGPNYLT